MSIQICVLLLGTNLGDKKNNLKKAKTLISSYLGEVIKETFILENKAVGFSSTHSFLNQIIVLETQLSPISLLNKIKAIEKELGRQEDSSISKQYRDRIIDIDILTYNNMKYIDNRLRIPHIDNVYNRTFSKKLITFI